MAGLRFEQQQNIKNIQPLLQREAQQATAGLSGISRAGLFDVENDLGPFADAVAELQRTVAAGTPDINAFRQDIAEIAGTLSESDPFRTIAEGMLAATDRASKLQSDLGQAQAALQGLSGDSASAAAALGKLPKGFEDTSSAAERAKASVAAFKAELQGLNGAGGAASASSGAPDSGFASPFAAGGVVDRATFFAFGAGGRLGLMGEAGPEAIIPLTGGRVGAVDAGGRQGSLPLARMAGGKLGVRALPFAAGGVLGPASNDNGAISVTASGAATTGAGGLPGLQGQFDALSGSVDTLNQKLAAGVAGWDIYLRTGNDVSKAMQGQWAASLQGSIGQIQGFTGALAQESDKWSTINKAAGIANALISTYRGAAKALELGPIIGPVLAGVTVATGLAYVAQIASSGSGSGGGAASAASPVGTGAFAGAPPAAGPQPAGPTQNIFLYGSSFDSDQIEALVNSINAHRRDGGTAVIAA